MSRPAITDAPATISVPACTRSANARPRRHRMIAVITARVRPCHRTCPSGSAVPSAPTAATTAAPITMPVWY
ncbi:Uncharacterised protein [Mycobacteroides abscessus subsp. abscessus]|nr:Uncharacterised protein [Mycobacteroides abscessus subsp. abscessus]